MPKIKPRMAELKLHGAPCRTGHKSPCFCLTILMLVFIGNYRSLLLRVVSSGFGNVFALLEITVRSPESGGQLGQNMKKFARIFSRK